MAVWQQVPDLAVQGTWMYVHVLTSEMGKTTVSSLTVVRRWRVYFSLLHSLQNDMYFCQLSHTL